MALFNLLAVDNFELVRAVAPRTIAPAAITTVRSLDEKEEIEPWIQVILYDTNRTPHGPSEISDFPIQVTQCRIRSPVTMPQQRKVGDISQLPFV
jgi:hypothetical protein